MLSVYNWETVGRVMAASALTRQSYKDTNGGMATGGASMISKPLWFWDGIVLFQNARFHAITDSEFHSVLESPQAISVWWVETLSCVHVCKRNL